jgi:hypothetical protein
VTPKPTSSPVPRGPLRRVATGVGLALTMLPITACECTGVVEADTGIPSDRPVRLQASWCDAKVCIDSTLDSATVASDVSEGFRLSDRNGRWFVELVNPPPKHDVGPAVLEIREPARGTLIIRAASNHESDDDCVFLSVAGPPRP